MTDKHIELPICPTCHNYGFRIVISFCSTLNALAAFHNNIPINSNRINCDCNRARKDIKEEAASLKKKSKNPFSKISV